MQWTAEKIKELREKYTITQATLAEILGTTQQVVNAWENKHYEPRTVYNNAIATAAEQFKFLMLDANDNLLKFHEKLNAYYQLKIQSYPRRRRTPEEIADAVRKKEAREHAKSQASGGSVPARPAKDTETPDQASSSFKVVATTAGVHLEGRSTPFKTPGDFAELAKTIGLAGQEFVTLQKALRERLAGH